MLKKCFGIVSWFPEKEPERTQRQERINRLFKQLTNLWPDIDILVIAQNWEDFNPIKTTNKQIIKIYEPLGILGARQALRTEFLASDYDYIIMLDDDAIISCSDKMAPLNYMNELDKHPNGFCFIHGKTEYTYDNYKSAQLNLCAISRYIYEHEPMVNVDPQKSQGFEDHIFSVLLHLKWRKFEFNPPQGITHTQFQNSAEWVPSTWARERDLNFKAMTFNTNKLIEYIANNKKLPENIESYLKNYGYQEPKPTNRRGDGSLKNTYLYF